MSLLLVCPEKDGHFYLVSTSGYVVGRLSVRTVDNLKPISEVLQIIGRIDPQYIETKAWVTSKDHISVDIYIWEYDDIDLDECEDLNRLLCLFDTCAT